MEKIVFPSKIKGEVIAPASKSMVQRLLACSVLAQGTTKLFNYTPCDDNEVAIRIITQLGANVIRENNTLIIESKGVHERVESLQIRSGESGLSSRLFTPLSLLFSEKVEIDGEGSLKKRPFGIIMQDIFSQLKIEYKDANGFLPINLRGELKGGILHVDGIGGSQFLTGLLMALPVLENLSILKVDNLKSKPYIDLTLDILSQFGVTINNNEYTTFSIDGGQTYKSCETNIEGDWSGASCLLVAGAIAGRIKVNNLDSNSKQADREILKALHDMSCFEILEENSSVSIERVRGRGKNNCRPFVFDATHCPDLFPALVALATKCEGTSVIKGVNRLATKESDRGVALKEEYAKLGIDVFIGGDLMKIDGGKVKGGTVFSHNDHRIAMSLATAALTADSPVTILGAECINKSYPQFWDHLDMLSEINQKS